jgi:hypothetical protein
MSEYDNDGFYWEPEPQDDLRQGDLLYNVPIALIPQRPRFVLGVIDTVQTVTFNDYPDNAPSDAIVVEARFGVLGIVVTPTCYVSETEKDEDVVSVVPVQATNLVIPDIGQARAVMAGKHVPRPPVRAAPNRTRGRGPWIQRRRADLRLALEVLRRTATRAYRGSAVAHDRRRGSGGNGRSATTAVSR